MPTIDIDETLVIESMIEYEGFTVEEAALTYKQRANLPSSAFCGPNRTYPAHDKRRIRAALQRLSMFGRRLKPATRQRIFNCVLRRAKRMGIEVSDDVKSKFGKKVSESLNESVVEWYLKRIKGG